jgi:hypothetical protein
MNRQNPITEDYKLLLVFRNIGIKLLQQLREAMYRPPYNTFFKEVPAAPHEIRFSYLGHQFTTAVELFFNHSKMPKTAFVATYLLSENGTAREEIIQYSFDLGYNINGIYKLDDFAEFYLIEFHENLKKSFSDHHHPFPLRVTDK